MNVNGILGIGTSVAVDTGGVNMQPRDCRRSAEPEEDVDARLPCYRFAIKTFEHSVMRKLAHFYYSCAGSSSDNGSSSTNIECVMAVPTGPDDVYYKLMIIFNYSFQRSITEDFCSCSKRFWSPFYTFYVQCSEKRPDLSRMNDIWCKDVIQG